MSRLLIAAVAASGLAACAPVYDAEMDQRAAARFNAEIAGMAAGRPQNCLPPRSTANVVAARGPTLLFREGNAVWANETSGGCAAVADRQYALVTENFSGALCRGSLAKVVDLTAGGMIRGTCVLGDFTPFRRR